VTLRVERATASAELEFEKAATLHAQVQKVEGVRALAPELVQPMNKLRALVLQASAPPAVGPTAPSAPAADVAVFLYQQGQIRGPVMFSTLGMRVQNERSGSSSLFAQPMAIEAVPEEQGSRDQGSGISEVPAAGTESASEAVPAKPPRGMLEARLEAVLGELMKPMTSPGAVERQGHLALLKRWYYRPEVKRVGEVFFPDEDGSWPVKAILRGVGRVAAQSLATPTRE